MKYSVKEILIKELVEMIDRNKIDLNPDYQRNFIWTPKDQSYLIDTILNGYPIPSFFMYESNKNEREMVDGQQRTKTIYRFIKGKISSSKETGAIYFSEKDNADLLNYRLPFIILKDIESKEVLRDFYVLINKKGKHLNSPEVHKSEYFDKNFMQLANDVLSYQSFIDLNLFTEASSKRMNDRDFVQELLVYLFLGIRDKKTDVEKLFERDISLEEYNQLKERFKKIIDNIIIFNDIEPIKKTRYKQKNDFYTLFCFVNENLELDIHILKEQYKILLVLNGKDLEGNQFIRPTNEDCEELKEYAINCVSQSNSKKAREKRLYLFNKWLKNRDLDKNEELINVLNYLSSIFGKDKISLSQVGEFQLLDTYKILN